MKTVPFDLTKALNKEPIITRDGRIPSEIYYFSTAKLEHKLVAIIDGNPVSFYDNGKIYVQTESDEDLLMQVPTIKKSGWINVYKYNKAECRFNSEQEAKDYHNHLHRDNIQNPLVACIKIEWEE